MEDVHLDGVVCQGIDVNPWAQLVTSLLGHLGEVHQQTLQRRARCSARTWCQIGLARTRNGAAPERFRNPLLQGFKALSVAQNQDAAGLQCGHAELQASHHGALRMSAGVARIAQHKDIARHGLTSPRHWKSAKQHRRQCRSAPASPRSPG